MVNRVTKKEREIIHNRIRHLLRYDESTGLALNEHAVAVAIYLEFGISRDRAIRYTSTVARIEYGHYVRQREERRIDHG